MKKSALMCKEDTIVICTYIFIYILSEKSFSCSLFLFWFHILLFLLLVCFPEEALVTAHEYFHLNEIEFITCVYFILLFIPHLFTFYLCFFYHWIHPTLVFCGRGCTMLPWWSTGGAGECWFVGEVPREVFAVIIRCSHWEPHSSTSGCLTEGRAGGQLTVEWCSKTSAAGNGLAGDIIPACPVCVTNIVNTTVFVIVVWVTENARVFISSGIFNIFQIWNFFERLL